MSAKKILFITQEITPYLPESAIATTCRHLPQAIQEKGKEIRTFMPRFGSVNERRNQLHEVIRLSGMNLIINDTDHPLIIKVASIQSARMQIYFIDNDDFFKRKASTVDDNGVEYPDNDERSIFYVRGVLETVKKLRWMPDIIHCHGWMTALTPLFIKTNYADDPCLKNAKVIYSLYNDEFKETFNPDFAEKIKFGNISDKDVKFIDKETDYKTLTEFAINYSDGVIQMEKDANKDALAYANKQGKKTLDFLENPENFISDIDKFYDNL